MILEPEAVADLLVFLIFSLNARTADEGRSFLSKPGGGNRLGEKLFADGVTLRSDPFNPRNPGTPWADGGGRRRFAAVAAAAGCRPDKTTWIENGVVKNARRRPLLGEKDQGRAGPALRRPDPGRLGQVARSPDRRDRAGAARHPVLVHPLRQPARTPWPPASTRDGVWLIENGKIVHPVNNFRFNDSPVNLLKNLEATSVAVRAGGSEFFALTVPAIRAHDFHFTSKSDAV